MLYDLKQQLWNNLQQQYPNLSVSISVLYALNLTTLISYDIATSEASSELRLLLRLRNRNQTDIRQKRVIAIKVPESLEVELAEIAWVHPLEVALPPPPGLDRPGLRLFSGSTGTRSGRRALRAELVIPAFTEMLSTISYRPLIQAGQVRARFLAHGFVEGQWVEISCEGLIGQWVGLGVQELVVEDLSSERIDPWLKPVEVLRLPEAPGHERALSELGLDAIETQQLIQLGIHTLGALQRADLRALKGERPWRQWQAMAELMVWDTSLSKIDAQVLVYGFYLRHHGDRNDFKMPSLEKARLIVSDLNLPSDYDLEGLLRRVAVSASS